MKHGCHFEKKCGMCGWCCHFTKETDLSFEEDFSLRKYVLEKQGVVYLFPLSSCNLTLTFEEKVRLEKLGAKIIPKRVYVDGTVIDYTFDAKVCPFLKDNKCSVYLDRPHICKCFPSKPSDDFYAVEMKPYGKVSNSEFEKIVADLKKKLL
jgi:Fe-S-cluster containining protein